MAVIGMPMFTAVMGEELRVDNQPMFPVTLLEFP